MQHNKYSKILPLATVLFFMGSGYVGLSASPWSSPLAQVPKPKAQPNKGQQIRLNSADLLTFDAYLHPDVQRLIGNVSFSHGNATMTCDSAYLNEKEQTFEAFGNVHLVQADTINMYSQYLYYDGKTRLARLRHQVKLENSTTTVFTDSLDYDRVADMAYYFDGGTVVDAQNTLTSDYGQFYPKTNDAEFRYNVKLVNDSTEMTTEHLFYNTKTRVGHYNGTTEIRSDSGYIASKRGAYDLDKNVGILLDRSEVYSGNRMLVGDSIYYDGTTSFGEAFGAMELHDTLQRVSLYGDYGYFDKQRDYGFTTSRAYALDYSQQDTLYIGADTLELVSFRRDFLADTTHLHPARVPQDSLARELRAHQRVKVYRHDAQALATSLRYRHLDSVLTLTGAPMLWQEVKRQVSGDTIIFYFRDKKLDYNDVLGNGFAIEQMPDQQSYYNQVKASSIRSYMQDSTVRRIELKGDVVESVYYMKDEKENDYSGMNRMTSTSMIVQLDSGRPKHTYWGGEVKGKLYPIAMAKSQQVDKLEGFNWAIERRPKRPEDVISQDSTGAPSLSDLKRFSGAKAALAIYEPYEKNQSELRSLADSIRKGYSEKAKDYTYPYILRPSKDEASPIHLKRAEQLINEPWQYNPFSVPEDRGPSSINISTTIPARKPKQDDMSASETSSSTQGK
ncbi:MAG: OstA-like protein [Porphyromonas sp.]|nr:OstA-like protein [Porphyromonas sp.]